MSGKQVDVNWPVARAAAAIGVSKKTVSIVKKIWKGEPFPEDDERHRDMEVPEEFIPVIWKALMGMYATKEHVTIDSLFNKLKKRVNTRQTDWHWSRATLHRFITSKKNLVMVCRSLLTGN